MANTVLVVDDQPAARRVLAAELEDAGFEVILAANGADAWERFCKDAPDAVVTDMVMPRSDGIELLNRIRSRSEVPVILFSAHGSVETAVAALKAGADDFVSSVSFDVDDLVQRVRDSVRGTAGDSAPRDPLADRLVGASALMDTARRRIAALAPLRAPVLVVGEPGSGRHTVAGLLQELGSSAAGRLTSVSAESFAPGEALPERGALYLEDVQRLAPAGQRFWSDWLERAERGRYESGPRLIASTPQPLAACVAETGFAPALAERLGRLSVELPPLRERPGDVPLLAGVLLERAADSLGRRGARLSAEALDCLERLSWPGNVAQLEQVLVRSLAFCREREIPRRVVEEVVADVADSLTAIRAGREARERDALLRAIQDTGGNVTRAAEVLGRSRSAVYRLIAKHGVRLAPRG